jgi:hypothetical protein
VRVLIVLNLAKGASIMRRLEPRRLQRRICTPQKNEHAH